MVLGSSFIDIVAGYAIANAPASTCDADSARFAEGEHGSNVRCQAPRVDGLPVASLNVPERAQPLLLLLGQVHPRKGRPQTGAGLLERANILREAAS